MKQGARDYLKEPILVDRAYSFGVGIWEPGRRGSGTLTLTEDTLSFTPAGKGRPIEIPLDTVDTLGTAVRRRGGPKTSAVLRVTYRGNLVLGLAVESPETWVHAIQSLTGHRKRKPEIERPVATRLEMRRFRIVVGMFLLVIVLLSTMLPLFFTWVNARVNRPAPAAPAAEIPGPVFGT